MHYKAHEVKNQRVIAKRTSQIIKYGQCQYHNSTLFRYQIINMDPV